MKKLAWLSTLLFMQGAFYLTEARAESINATGHGTGQSPTGLILPDPSGAPIVQASATSDDKNATLSITFNLPPISHWDLFGLGADSSQAQYLTISGQTPIGQGTNYTNVSTLDGLTKSTSIKFQYIYVDGAFQRNTGGTSFESDNYQNECRRLIAQAKVSLDSGELCLDNDIQSALTRLTDQDAANKKKLDTASVADRPKILAQLANNEVVEASIRKGEAKLADNASAKLDSIWMLSFNGKVGYEQHTYYDPTSLAKTALDKTPFQMGAELTKVFAAGDASINLAFNYQQASVVSQR